MLGGRPPADPADPPRYLVRVTAPASWRKELSGYAVEKITEALAETEWAAGRDPNGVSPARTKLRAWGRVRREPHAIVLVDGITEGGIGIHGKAMGTMELMELMSRPYRDATTTRPAPDLPPDTVIDPICGMRVELDDTAITLIHDGVTYGFCHGLCRRAFADENGVPPGQ